MANKTAKEAQESASATLAGRLDQLDRSIVAASNSTEKLSTVLNKITCLSVLVAVLGILIAAISLGFDIYKYRHGMH